MFDKLMEEARAAKTNADRSDMIYKISLAFVEGQITQDQDIAIVNTLVNGAKENV